LFTKGNAEPFVTIRDRSNPETRILVPRGLDALDRKGLAEIQNIIGIKLGLDGSHQVQGAGIQLAVHKVPFGNSNAVFPGQGSAK